MIAAEQALDTVPATVESMPGAARFERPLLVIAGLPRTATTALFENLARNPGFARALRKEVNYFLESGELTARKYENLFSDWIAGQVCLDVSPYYSLDPAVPARIKALAPHARAVLLLREPVEWLFSFYAQLVSCIPYARPTFAEFTSGASPARMPGVPDRSLGGALYPDIVKAFQAAFGDRLLLLDYARVRADFLGALKRIEAFAGAPSWFDAQNTDTRFYNSSDTAERSSVLLRYLVSRDWAIRLIPRLFSARLIERVRARLFLAPRSEARPPEFSPADQAAARELMRQSIAYYEKIFLNCPHGSAP